MSLTAQDLTAIKDIVKDIVDTSIEKSNDALSLQIGQGFNEVTERFEVVEADIAELKSDVAELKSDVAELKSDVAELKLDMREVKWSLADTVRRPEFLDLRARVERLEHPSHG